MVRHTMSRRVLLKSVAAGAGILLLDRVGAGQVAAQSGTTTSVAPYIVPSIPGVRTTAILTVGEAASNGYRMVGVPDGLGALRGDGTFTLFMNHELRATFGAVRAHGSKGAFVSRWTIDRQSLQVLSGADLTPSAASANLWDSASRSYVQGTTAFDVFCSADLPDRSAFQHLNRGTNARLFLNGEEVGNGRAFAHIVSGPNAGEAWQLPRLGRMPFENVVASPSGRNKTIVVLLEHGSVSTAPIVANNPSELYVYVGEKRSTGTPIARAGLTTGSLYGLRVRRDGVVTEESNAYGLGSATSGYLGTANFELVQLGEGGDVSEWSAAQLETDAIAKDIFRMQAIEDGAWDPRGDRARDFYFVTTASVELNSRLWRLRFRDLGRPEAGGVIEILLNVTAGRMFDNLTIDRLGRVLLQEDVGNEAHNGKIWLYGIDSGALVEVARHDPELFEPGRNPARFITQNEESSGIIDARDILGRGWFLLDDQVHKPDPDPELVEGGQLLAMYVDPRIGRG